MKRVESMERSRIRAARLAFVFLCALVLGACARPRPSAAPLQAGTPEPAPTATAVPEMNVPPAPRLEAPVPVFADDGMWGNSDAPVEIVAFVDLQCPFSARVQSTLGVLRERYGKERLHLVTKHLPLPFHAQAHLAAQAARVVLETAGQDAFDTFAQLVFSDQGNLDRDHLLRWAELAGASRTQVEASMDAPPVVERVDQDSALAARLGIYGTPSFLINGVRLSGAQPIENFIAIVAPELAKAEELRKAGTPPNAISALRTVANYTEPSAAPASARPAEDHVTVWKIPIDKSPVLGDPGALVTIVAFLDFQCPFRRRVQATLRELQSRYGRDLRIVFKHNPLPFHYQAMPAAMLALEARAEKGDAAFWRAVDACRGAAVARRNAACTRNRANTPSLGTG